MEWNKPTFNGGSRIMAYIIESCEVGHTAWRSCGSVDAHRNKYVENLENVENVENIKNVENVGNVNSRTDILCNHMESANMPHDLYVYMHNMETDQCPSYYSDILCQIYIRVMNITSVLLLRTIKDQVLFVKPIGQSEQRSPKVRVLHVTIRVLHDSVRVLHDSVRVLHVTIRVLHVSIRVLHVCIRVLHVIVSDAEIHTPCKSGYTFSCLFTLYSIR